MTENTGHFEATKEAFDRVVEKFRKNNKRNYDFLVKGGGKVSALNIFASEKNDR